MEKSRIVRQFGNVAIANVAKLIYSVLDKKGVEEVPLPYFYYFVHYFFMLRHFQIVE